MAASKSPLSIRQARQPEELEREIRLLEDELLEVERKINGFTQLIRVRLAGQIRLLNELTELYKAQKKAKKEKRLEQKKKGKNYREPAFSLTRPFTGKVAFSLSPVKNEELKRLYKEAIVRVHPDKFATGDEETAHRATDVTRQLITLYKAGQLDALRDYHEYILSGNAMAHVPFSLKDIPDPLNMLSFLQKKRDELLRQLTGMKESRLYEVLTTYDDPEAFVEELRIAYAERIETFQKRTRTSAGR